MKQSVEPLSKYTYKILYEYMLKGIFETLNHHEYIVYIESKFHFYLVNCYDLFVCKINNNNNNNKEKTKHSFCFAAIPDYESV